MNPASATLIDDRIKSPRYMQVYASLYQWIVQGHYAPGDQLEPETRLCEIFGVSRITVRRAIEMLVAEGLARSVQGKGTFITPDNPGPPVRADMEQRIRKARQLARNSEVADLRIETRPAPDEVAADLGIEAGTDVQFVAYVRRIHGAAIGYVESYLPASVGLVAEDFGASTMLTILEDKGVRLSGIDHLIGATLADTKLAALIGIPVGMPLVRIKMVMLDAAHRPVERVLAHFRADQYEHHMFLARDTLARQLDDAAEAAAAQE